MERAIPIRLRLTRTSLCALVLVGHVACTNAAVDKAVGDTTGTSTIVVARADRGITVENRAGRPLLNIRIEIEGRDAGNFVYVLPTLDPGLTREIPFADFRTEDGTLFNGSAAAKQIKTTARDTLGNRYSVTTPWEPGQ
jgi:hypothetical protein